METNNKNRGRCHFNKKRLKKRIFLFSLFIVIALSFFLLISVDKRLNLILSNYVKTESERVVSRVVNKSISEINSSDVNQYLKIDDMKLNYNFSEINKYKNMLAKTIENNLSEIEHGNFDKYDFHYYNQNKYKYIKNGFLCEVSFNATRGSTLFSNVGPNIPLKLSFVDSIKVDIDFNIKEYGINNIFIETFANVEVNSQVSMPVNSKKFKIRVKEPITADIIKGDIPEYFSMMNR